MNLTCIVCPNGCSLQVEKTQQAIVVTGHKCPRGKVFAERELTNPTRSVCTTVRTKSVAAPTLPIRTDGEIPKDRIMEFMREAAQIVVQASVRIGDVVIENVAESGVNAIATADFDS